MKKSNVAAIFAILAAALYAINVPLSKILLQRVGPAMMAALLYLGAGLGLMAYSLLHRAEGRPAAKEPLTRKEFPYAAAMVVLDIAAPILLMLGLTYTSSANVSLLNNFEIVATSLVALFIFREMLSKHLWIAMILVTLASILLELEDVRGFQFNVGSLFVLGACICWGFENNCTRMMSRKSAIEIVTVKGCFSGLGSLLIALAVGERLPEWRFIFAVLALGFIAYGLSITFYIQAQKELGAAKTSVYYSIAPFIGVAFSMIFLGERPGSYFYLALAIMAVSTFILMHDTIALQHAHPHTHLHNHEHRHGTLLHTHEHAHTHTHYHIHTADEELHLHPHKELPNHQHCHPSDIRGY